MAWDASRARKRIKNFIESAPEVEEGISLAAHFRLVTEAAALAKAQGSFPRGRAVLVKGVHVYGQLLDFDNVVADGGRETEASHRDVLRFLNLHYRVWDAVVEDNGADRVDYHGPRLHAIITEPEKNPAEQLKKAIALAAQLADAAKHVCAAYGMPGRIRFGIDYGSCLAMSTGRAYEKDTLFLGSAANHAAKLAASEEREGIFLTPNAQRILDIGDRGVSGDAVQLDKMRVAEAVKTYHFSALEQASQRLIEEADNEPIFRFHRSAPPLSNLNFEDLTPAKSVRMGMASLFADIDGFTSYVDHAIAEGSAAIEGVVVALHVLREELNSVLKDDFGGKRVRFIGDCIQGLIAAGDAEDDPVEAVKDAVLCAAGMRSSFDLCQEILSGIDELDLAIGIEFGPVPLTRLGLRGEDSVRCAAGRAVVQSEREQQAIDGGGIRLGSVALGFSGEPVRRLGNSKRIASFADAADILGDESSPLVKIIREDPSARPYLVR